MRDQLYKIHIVILYCLPKATRVARQALAVLATACLVFPSVAAAWNSKAHVAATHEPPAPNLKTQLHILLDTLNSNDEDGLKCYDLAWVANLMGELHQPLHCSTRFSAVHPGGDKCGREVKLCASPCTDNLHDYWDGLMGTESDLQAGLDLGKSLLRVQGLPELFEDVDVDRWLKESANVAATAVYTPVVVSEDDAGHIVTLTADYRKDATETAKRQVVLAGNRLAEVLNSNLN